MISDLSVNQLASVLISHFHDVGVLVDIERLNAYFQQMSSACRQLEDELYRLCGVCDFRLMNGDEFNQVLFTDEGYLNLPSAGLEKSEYGFYSLGKKSLRQWRCVDIIVDKFFLLNALRRELRYLRAIMQCDIDDGMLHPTYHMADTGRIICSEPPLQGLPKRNPLVPLRELIIAPSNHVILAADYSQIELRMLAHLSEERALINAFETGRDIHRETASLVFGIPVDAVTDNQRKFAKRVNFGIIYGKTAHSLADELPDVLLEEGEDAYHAAHRFVNRYWDNLPHVQSYFEQVVRFVKQNGYVETLMGFRRDFSQLPAGAGLKGHEVSALYRQAKNTVIQGSAADIFKLATHHLLEKLGDGGYGTRIIIPVHDELVFDVPIAELEPVTRLIVDTMENVYSLRVPLKVNLEVGQSWGNMIEIDLPPA